VHSGKRVLGTVKRLLALPSCEVLEVSRAGEGPPLLVPLVGDAVSRVDVRARLIEVDAGFLGEV
jgi:ribosomal 30S subunit maturation factor RimM